ncbi:hypothetical protein EDD21DRAFT_351606 [Dissophora ornata]|nr:hypothetical protein EDD21DRAFT_351606 [Dissophora ornata]
MNMDNPPVPAFIPPNARLLIHVQRAQELELRKRKHENEIAKAFKECNARLRELWVRMGEYVLKEGSRKSTLDNMRAKAAAVENTCRDLKGVNEIGAARRVNDYRREAEIITPLFH